jgi:hypothetical protein
MVPKLAIVNTPTPQILSLLMNWHNYKQQVNLVPHNTQISQGRFVIVRFISSLNNTLATNSLMGGVNIPHYQTDPLPSILLAPMEVVIL